MHPIASALVTATALLGLAACAGNRPAPEAPVESQVPAAQATDALAADESVVETETDAQAEHVDHGHTDVGGETDAAE